jgi:hypothetical protein
MDSLYVFQVLQYHILTHLTGEQLIFYIEVVLCMLLSILIAFFVACVTHLGLEHGQQIIRLN